MPLENQLRVVKGMLYDRRDTVYNGARTTLALGLMRLRLTSSTNNATTNVISEELEANGGRP
ncbi:MAG TPA: hypothetical protein VF998_04650 [Candidatus Limnocylindria bacterium]